MLDREKLTPELLADTERQLLTLPPMTRETDLVLRDYYLFAAEELGKIPDVTLPATIYLREVATLQDVGDVYQLMRDASFNAMKARGRNNFGQIGPWFWNTSDVHDLGESFARMGMAVDKAYHWLKDRGIVSGRRTSI